MTAARALRIAALLAPVAVTAVGAGASSAAFTAGSAAAPTSTFGTSPDWIPPAVTLVSPADGALTNNPTPTLSGAAGNAAGDGATVNVKLWTGSVPAGAPRQLLTATRSGAAWSVGAATLPDGTYTARADQSDTYGNVGTSTAHSFAVDATAPTASSIAASNGGGVGTLAGHLDAGDTIVFGYSEAIAPASIMVGFSGASTQVSVRFFNAGPGGNKDTFTVLGPSATDIVHLDAGTTTAGGVSTEGDFVSGTVTFAATLVRSVDGKTFTVALGSADAPASIRATVVAAKNMVWTVDRTATDLAGNAVTTTTVTETDLDRDF
jgi:hypothetical protein